MTQARSISIAVILIVVVFGAGFAGGYFWPKRQAPNPQTNGTDRPDNDPRMRRPRPGRIFGHMVRRLELSESQIASVQNVLRTYKPQMRALHQKIRPEVDAIRAKMRDEIRKLLTEKQRGEFDRMLAEHDRTRRSRMRRYRRGPGPLGPRPPHLERRGPRFERRRPEPPLQPSTPDAQTPPTHP